MNYHNNPKVKIAACLVALGIVITICFWRSRDIPADNTRWQAIFLTDGQVYFGKLANYNSRFAVLDQVYYLKFSEGLQQGKASLLAGQLNLIKLGGEAHGPENKMFVAKDKILFIENLKNTSLVVQAITSSNKALQ